MRNFDLQVIWSSQTPFHIPGFLALHVQIEAERSLISLDNLVDKWFPETEPEDKMSMSFINLN
jgi:hypothetical protein